MNSITHSAEQWTPAHNAHLIVVLCMGPLRAVAVASSQSRHNRLLFAHRQLPVETNREYDRSIWGSVLTLAPIRLEKLCIRTASGRNYHNVRTRSHKAPGQWIRLSCTFESFFDSVRPGEQRALVRLSNSSAAATRARVRGNNTQIN